MLEERAKLANNYVKEACSAIDRMEIPHPIPYHLVLRDRDLQLRIAEIGLERYESGLATAAFQISTPKGKLSFRKFSKLSPANLIAQELFAREFAVKLAVPDKNICVSLRFDKNLPKRLYPEKKKTDRQRWKQFSELKIEYSSNKSAASEDMRVLTADIARYFDYIEHSRLLNELEKLYPDQPMLLLRFSRFLEATVGSTMGLPVGPQSSFVFGDLFLLNSDSIAYKGVNNCVRWADEIWWFDPRLSRLEEKYRELLIALNGLGLTFNEGKSFFMSREEMLVDEDTYAHFRKEYYRFKKETPSLVAAFVCGVMIQRFRSGESGKLIDRFLLNRLREAFLDEGLGDSIQPIVETAFQYACENSREAIHQWHGILKILPNKARVLNVAKKALSQFPSLMDSDKARLLELAASLKAEVALPMTRRQLRSVATNNAHCSSFRGNALRSWFCQTRDINATRNLIEAIVSESNCPELLMYCASTALLLPVIDCHAVLNELETTTQDPEMEVIIEGYRRLRGQPLDEPWLPSHKSIVMAELAQYQRDPY